MFDQESTLNFLQDILPKDQKFWHRLKKHVRHRARQAGFKRITTPLIEPIELFQQSRKRQFQFLENFLVTTELGDRIAVLRPENTTPIIRSYVNNNMHELPQPIEVYYMEPIIKKMKDTFEQSFEYGFELIGEDDPALDAQMIYLNYLICKDCNLIDHLKLHINTYGSRSEINDYRQAIKDYFIGKERSLSQQSLSYLDSDPLQLFQNHNEDEAILLQLAPKLSEFISDESKEYYNLVKEYLSELGIPFSEVDFPLSDFDLYNGVVFSFVELDKQENIITQGGHHDSITKRLCDEPLKAIGFSTDMNKIVQIMKEQNIIVVDKDEIQVFVAQIGQRAKKKSLSLLAQIRAIGINAIGSMGKSSIRSQMEYADKFAARWCVLIGDTEVIQNSAIIKDMQTGMQSTVSQDDLLRELVDKIGENNIPHFQPQLMNM